MVTNVFANVFDDKPREMRCLIDGGLHSIVHFSFSRGRQIFETHNSEFSLENFQNHRGLS